MTTMTPEELSSHVEAARAFANDCPARLRDLVTEYRTLQASADAARATCHELMDDLVAAEAERDKLRALLAEVSGDNRHNVWTMREFESWHDRAAAALYGKELTT